MANRSRTGTDEIDELMYIIKTLIGGILNAKERQRKDLITNKEWYAIRKNALNEVESYIRAWKTELLRGKKNEII